MSYEINGTNIFDLGEWVPSTVSKNAHAISTSNYKILGNNFQSFGKSLVATTSGFHYSNEVFTTPYKINGTQAVLCNKGCRPTLKSLLWSTQSTGGWYINPFSDGEMWVSTESGQRSGTKISNSIASGIYPNGIKYLIIRLVGDGGNGGNASGINGASGGGGGATAVILVKVETVHNLARILGGSTFYFNGTGVVANGGGSGTIAGNGGAGGTVTGNPGVDGYLWKLATASGGNGGNTNGTTSGSSGGGSSITFSNASPEDGTVTWSGSGGGFENNGIYEGGGGGASTLGNGGAAKGNSAGEAGKGPGAGGAGGTGYWFQNHAGGAGQPGGIWIFY